MIFQSPLVCLIKYEIIKNSSTFIFYYLSQKNSSSKSFERQAFSRITFALLHFLHPCCNCSRCFGSLSKSPEHINVQILSRAPSNMHFSFSDLIVENSNLYAVSCIYAGIRYRLCSIDYDLFSQNLSCLSSNSIVSKISKTKSRLNPNSADKKIQKH